MLQRLSGTFLGSCFVNSKNPNFSSYSYLTKIIFLIDILIFTKSTFYIYTINYMKNIHYFVVI